MTRYAQKLLRRMAPGRPAEVLRPTSLPKRTDDTLHIDPFENVAAPQEPLPGEVVATDPDPLLRSKTVPSPQPTRYPRPSPFAEPIPTEAQQFERATSFTLPRRSQTTSPQPTEDVLSSVQAGSAEPSVPPYAPTSLHTAGRVEMRAMPHARPSPSSPLPPEETPTKVKSTESSERRPYLRPEPVDLDQPTREAPPIAPRAVAPVAPLPSLEPTRVPPSFSQPASDGPTPATELQPPPAPPPSIPRPSPAEPRVVIGRLTVEVMPPPAPVPSRSTRSHRRAAKPAEPSAPNAPPSKLRFGLGQM